MLEDAGLTTEQAAAKDVKTDVQQIEAVLKPVLDLLSGASKITITITVEPK